jgi:hypothetical protein
MFHLLHSARAYPAVYAPYCDRFNFYEGREVWLGSIAGIPEKAVHLFSLHWLHLEVYNGGFWQYFFNSTATSAPEACDGFRAIGMDDVAAVVETAMSKLGTPFPFDKSEREAIVGGPRDRMDFNEEDSAFYDLADTEQLFGRLPKFVPFADAYAQKMA